MRRFLQNLMGQGRGESGSEQSSEHDLQVATAALLLEIAKIDDEFSGDERVEIIKVLKEHFEISEDEVGKILETSQKEINNQLDLYYFTKQINDQFDIDDKIKIIEMVWRVIYTDQHLNGHEDFLVHRFARLLHLDHDKLIDAKLRIKKEMKL
ncbi:MAG: TerB family tellurite resistance protein [candidate division Zixibacteria bacterium]